MPAPQRHSAACVSRMGSHSFVLKLPDQKRLRERVKHGLNTAAVEHMTRKRLRKSDPNDEVAGWLRAAAELARHAAMTTPRAT